MHHRYRFMRLTSVAAIMLAMLVLLPQGASAQSKSSLDIFSGLEVNFRDIDYLTQYDFMITFTPGFKWYLGNHWQVAGLCYLNVLNQYDSYYYNAYHPYLSGNRVFQHGILDVSKEFKLGGLFCKASAGFFTDSRYGIDLKMFLPLSDWFALEAQGGCTGRFTMTDGWGFSPMSRFAGTIGGDIYLSRWNTQLRGTIGSYLYTDYGFQAEAMRHFRHSTVSLYGRWSSYTNWGSDNSHIDGGFRVTVMLPPYHRTQRKVNFRPASNYLLPYSMNLHNYGNCMYLTDPEENDRDGWFSRDFLPWGSHNMEPDYIITEKE